MAYILIISLSGLLIALGCFLVEGIYTLSAFLMLLLSTAFEIAAVIVIDGFFVALVNFVLNLLPTFILRANTPALRRVYQRLRAREEKALEKIPVAK